MANFVFGDAGTGKVAQLVANVEAQTPSTCGIVWVPLSQSGTAEQGEALLTLAAVEADANFAEQAHASWGRIVQDDTHGVVVTWDATNNRNECDSNDLVWASPDTGNNTTGVIACYAPDTAGADSTFIPLLHLDMAVTANDQQVTFQFNAEGWFNATRS